MSRDELIIRIRKLAEELGHSPKRDELARHGISRKLVARHFGSQAHALLQCGLEPVLRGRGRPVDMKELFEDWATLARKLNRVPNFTEYEKGSRFSIRPLITRFRSWKNVPRAMRNYMEAQGLRTEWADVWEMIEAKLKGERGYRTMLENGVPPRVLTDRPLYGNFLAKGPMVCAPTNENGVLVLFGALAEQLGFLLLRVQIGFPDVEAWRIVGPDRLQWVRIEAEYQSRNFVLHGHNPKGCDLIVCWEHNWEDCPLEVIELKKFVG